MSWSESTWVAVIIWPVSALAIFLNLRWNTRFNSISPCSFLVAWRSTRVPGPLLLMMEVQESGGKNLVLLVFSVCISSASVISNVSSCQTITICFMSINWYTAVHVLSYFTRSLLLGFLICFCSFVLVIYNDHSRIKDEKERRKNYKGENIAADKILTLHFFSSIFPPFFRNHPLMCLYAHPSLLSLPLSLPPSSNRPQTFSPPLTLFTA